MFGVGAHSEIVGAGTNAQNIAFTRSVQGHTVEFKFGRNQCVADTRGGLSLQNCNGGAGQKFDEVGRGSSVALQNEGSHEYVRDNGHNRQVTTVRVRPDRRGQLNFSRAQRWKWVDVHPGRGGNGGGGQGGDGGGRTPAPRPVTATATSHISDHPDGGHGTTNPYWAEDTINRTVTVKLVGSTAADNCGASVAHCYSYTATLSDDGTFLANVGADAPNQSGTYADSKEVRPQARGTMIGGAPVTFYASSNHPDAALVARNYDNHGAVASGKFTTSLWVEQFFPNGTTFAAVSLPTYKWTYSTTNLQHRQTWVDSSSNGDGNAQGDGNIVG
ncbi:MAG TPA: hypothetical protein VGI00_22785 [Streptosporangiaceae bacterium]